MKRLAILLFLMPFITFAHDSLPWQNFDAKVFEQAKKENKLVLLYVEANWCHWCHVMQDSCYDNSEIQAYLKANYILAKADQDARPDVFQRYKEYGWPATVIFDGNATEIVKRRGYISPKPFLRLLNACVVDPSPEVEGVYSNSVLLNKDEETIKQTLKERFYESLDIEIGAYDMSQKYVAYEPFELALALNKENKATTWLKNTMEGALKLCDPVWGGVYQYSTNNDWNHIHFEKLLDRQARYIKMFALYYGKTKDQRFLDAALQTYAYCERFLSQKNDLYDNAQDADLIPGEHSEWYYDLPEKERLKHGLPSIDTNTYTVNNAKLAEAYLLLWAASGEQKIADKGLQILNALQKRKTNKGLLKHGFKENVPLALDDQINMLSALYVAHQAFPKHISSAEINVFSNAISNSFQQEKGSYKTSLDQTLSPFVDMGLHLKTLRVLNNIGQMLHSKPLQESVDKAMNYLQLSEVLSGLYSQPQYYLALEEISAKQWVKIMYVEGEKTSDLLQFKDLFLLPNFAKLILNKNSEHKTAYSFEKMEQAAVYVCTESFCSAPLESLDAVLDFMAY